MKSQKGYSLIEIGIGLLIIAVFSFFSIALFNGCYNNYRVIQQRNIAMSYAVSKVENILQSDLTTLGIVTDRDEILDAAAVASNEDLSDGNYAVPIDNIDGPSETTNNMTITTKYRRLPGTTTIAMDSSVIKVIVDVEYKIRTNDTESRHFTLETLKVTM